MENIKFTQIDESLLNEHTCLDPDDKCYFLGEYASGRKSQFSEMNQLIINFKKPMDRKDLPEWYYKQQAILKTAYWLGSSKGWEKLKTRTWIPIPPSKIKSDSNYDDRLVRVLTKLKEIEPDLDIRELLLAKSSREPAHNVAGKTRETEFHLNNLELDQSIKNPFPTSIVIFDDIITSGASFKAAQKILKIHFPQAPIIGIFIARNLKTDD